jgi:very-short-patch-repair endonuclease
MSKQPAHTLLEIHLREIGFDFVPEFKFHPTRKWRFDYLLKRWDVVPKIAVEIEGGIHARGRHTRGMGYEKDLEKYREATILGFSVYRFSTGEVLNGTAKTFLQRLRTL